MSPLELYKGLLLADAAEGSAEGQRPALPGAQPCPKLPLPLPILGWHPECSRSPVGDTASLHVCGRPPALLYHPLASDRPTATQL